MRAVRTTLTAVMPEADAPNALNPIHSTDSARDYGYRAALVGGATVYGWCTAAILDALGADWLVHGWADIAFRRPVFPNDRIEVRIDADDSLSVVGDDGRARIDGRVGLGRAEWFDTLTEPPDRKPQPPADPLPQLTPESIPIGRALRTRRVTLPRSDAEAFCRDKQHETRDLFYGERAFVHPAWLASQPIYWLHHSFEYGPAVHTASRIQHLAAAHVDDEFVVSGVCVDGFERNGHHYIVNDTAIDDRAGTTVARIRHTAIYRLKGSG
jgi:acyl dehydratase